MGIIQRFKQWWAAQHEPLTFRVADPSPERCHCCGNTFEGNYCPVCGQRKGAKRLTWSALRANVLDVWGLGSRSLPFTLWQLILRPGYFIGEYLNGRRQVSFPPVKMLVFVALAVLVILNYIDPDTESTDMGDDTLFDSFFDYLGDIFQRHYDWAVLSMLSFLIVPTWAVFRNSPRLPRHTLPEGAIIAVFLGVQVVMLILVVSLFEHFYAKFVPESPDELIGVSGYLFLAGLVFILFRNYRKLFCYSNWGTAWRMFYAVASGVFCLFSLIVVVYLISKYAERDLSTMLLKVPRLLPYALISVVFTVGGYFIDRFTSRRQKAERED